MDDELLVRYLVGATTDEETETLDEMSIAEEAFAVRLRAVEHDLVDAYVNGELTGDLLDRFTSHYLSSPAGLAKVDIAKALRDYRNQRASGRSSQKWLLAAAAVLLAAVATLVVDDLRLRRQATDARGRQTALEQRSRELQDTLAQEQARAREQPAVTTRAPASIGAGRLLSLVIFAATRDAQQLPTVSLANTVEGVTLQLDPGGDEFSEYRAALQEASTERVVWRSGPLRAVSAGGRSVLTMTVPATLLHRGEYAIKLTGVQTAGEPKVLDSYPFRVVLQ
ncbi:MAG TPA: hypothetical protein VFP91_22460 [Vicinamibacterales bacterium]|nr:hypothetical protein [Vicinamibacterales bacterium]